MNDEYDEEDLGGGLTKTELFWWANLKRAQNERCRSFGHTEFCRKCLNCLCFKWQTGMFRCMCEYGKTMTTPYRVRWQNEIDKKHDMNRYKT